MSDKPTGLPKLVTNLMLMRADLLRKLSNQKRNFNKEFGYPDAVDIGDCLELIKRDPIAARINAIYPEECWALPPKIRETNDESETTPFEKDLEDYIVDDIETGRTVKPGRDLLHYMQRGDLECGKGHFGVLLIGVGDGKKLDQPVEGFGQGDSKLYDATYFKVFQEGEIVITKYDIDTSSPRYCRPTEYEITYQGLNELNTTVSSANISMRSQKVHWHRVVHLVDNTGSNEIAGAPRLEVYFNSILDLRKLYGGSAEMFWKGGLPGWSVETLPEVAGANEMEPEDRENLKLEFQAWQDGLQRVLMLQNMTLKDHTPQLASPQYHILAQLQRIAFGLGCPLRILLGAEEARLASNQDTRNWNKKLTRRNRNQTTPNVVVPTITQMVDCRTLSRPKVIQCVWPDLNSPTAEDKADLAVKRMTALTKYVQTGASLVMGFEFFLIHEMGYSKDLAALCLKGRETKPFIPKAEGAIVSPNKQRTARASGESKAASSSSL